MSSPPDVDICQVLCLTEHGWPLESCRRTKPGESHEDCLQRHLNHVLAVCNSQEVTIAVNFLMGGSGDILDRLSPLLEKSKGQCNWQCCPPMPDASVVNSTSICGDDKHAFATPQASKILGTEQAARRRSENGLSGDRPPAAHSHAGAQSSMPSAVSATAGAAILSQASGDGPPAKKRKIASEGPETVSKSGDETADDSLKRLVDALPDRKKIVVVAGAGISVSAGIPDFRSSTGLFAASSQRGNPSGKDLFDISVYKDNTSTAHFHDMIRELANKSRKAKPTPFHHLLASLAQQGRLLRLYTQNIDCIDTSMEPLATHIPLDPNPPWPTTIQLHGGLGKMVCTKCREVEPFDSTLFHGPEAPLCSACKKVSTRDDKRSQSIGRLRPRIVLYDDYYTADEEAIGSVWGADVKMRPDAVLVVGTSLRIPATRKLVKELCEAARKGNGFAAWINIDPKPASVAELKDCWDIVVTADCDKVAVAISLPTWDGTALDVEPARRIVSMELPETYKPSSTPLQWSFDDEKALSFFNGIAESTRKRELGDLRKYPWKTVKRIVSDLIRERTETSEREKKRTTRALSVKVHAQRYDCLKALKLLKQGGLQDTEMPPPTAVTHGKNADEVKDMEETPKHVPFAERSRQSRVETDSEELPGSRSTPPLSANGPSQHLDGNVPPSIEAATEPIVVIPDDTPSPAPAKNQRNNQLRPKVVVHSSSIETLMDPGGWVNDEVVNGALSIIAELAVRPSKVISSLNLKPYENQAIRAEDWIFAALHLKPDKDEKTYHWVLAIIHPAPRRHRVKIYDSWPRGPDRQSQVEPQLQAICESLGMPMFEVIDWSSPIIQSDSCSCGVLVLASALYEGADCPVVSEIRDAPWRAAFSELLRPDTQGDEPKAGLMGFEGLMTAIPAVKDSVQRQYEAGKRCKELPGSCIEIFERLKSSCGSKSAARVRQVIRYLETARDNVGELHEQLELMKKLEGVRRHTGIEGQGDALPRPGSQD